MKNAQNFLAELVWINFIFYFHEYVFYFHFSYIVQEEYFLFSVCHNLNDFLSFCDVSTWKMHRFSLRIFCGNYSFTFMILFFIFMFHILYKKNILIMYKKDIFFCKKKIFFLHKKKIFFLHKKKIFFLCKKTIYVLYGSYMTFSTFYVKISSFFIFIYSDLGDE